MNQAFLREGGIGKGAGEVRGERPDDTKTLISLLNIQILDVALIG